MENLEMLDEEEVAKLFCITRQALRNWRKQRRGPRWVKIGSCVRYPVKDLADWIEAQPGGGGKEVAS